MRYLDIGLLGDGETHREDRLRVLIDVLRLHFRSFGELDMLSDITSLEDSKGFLIVRVNKRSKPRNIELIREATEKAWDLLDLGGVVEVYWQLTAAENNMTPEHRAMRERMR